MAQVLRLLETVRPERPKPALATFEEFERRLGRHFDWEENWLFPALAAQNGDAASSIRTMKEEHQEIHELAAKARGFLQGASERSAAKGLAGLQEALRTHELNEGRELFQALDGLLSAAETAAFLERLPRF